MRKILNETARKRRYRREERVLYKRLRELLPDDAFENEYRFTEKDFNSEYSDH